MKTKVGKQYILTGEKRKRKLSETIWAYIWGILFVFSLFSSIVSPNSGELSIIFGLIIGVFFIFFISSVHTSERIRTIEFLIHKYDRWNKKENKYKTLYIVEEVYLEAHYIFHKHIGDKIVKMSPEEVKTYCKNPGGTYDNFIGYTTKDGAMKEIIDEIKQIISQEKKQQQIQIKNAETLETFSVDELKDKLNRGDFKHLENYSNVNK